MDYPSSRRSPSAHLQNNHPDYARQTYDASSPISSQEHTNDSLLQPGGHFTEEWDATQRGSSILDGRNGTARRASLGGGGGSMHRSPSVSSYRPGDDQQLSTGGVPSRGNTLKKKSSMRRNGSLGRSASRRSMKAGSVRSLALQSSNDPDEAHSAFYCPVPTSGNPTEVLIARFQSWRKVLKDLISYFREIQNHYEQRGKSLAKLSNASNNVSMPPGFLTSAGIDDAIQSLRIYNRNAVAEANKAKDIEEDVILALTGLRSDLRQKIKEIKNLSGDFKNNVDKEMEHTSKAVRALQDVLGKNEVDDSSTTGKQDPFLLRLAVDRQVERQLDEENYLHQAYLNLESSGRELESIVVGEIQKAYNAYAGILKREADNAYGVMEELRDGPISMPKDQEWIHFITNDDQFFDPAIPLRSADQIHYPGQDHIAAQEIRAGLLERKSKYLKSYTAGWYVLSTTHLHEFKSADKGQAPIMSLYLPEQKLGSHSSGEGSSNKFILKGRQTGTMHRGHTWVFRAESHDTMMAWYEDIKALTEKTAEERSHFVRTHSRSLSQSSRRSASSDALDDDDDEEPFSAGSQIDVNPGPKQDAASRRTQPGGRFPSDIQVNAQRGLQAHRSTSSLSSSARERAISDTRASAAAAGGVAAAAGGAAVYGQGDEPSNAAVANQEAQYDGVNPYTGEPMQQPYPPQQQNTYSQHGHTYVVPVAAPSSYDNRQQAYETENRGERFTNADGVSPVSEHYTSSQPHKEAWFSTENQQQMAPAAVAAVPVAANQEPAVDSKTQDFGGSAAYVPSPTANSVPSGDDVPTRPVGNSSRHDSVNTITNHMPGGYPRTSVA